MSNEELKKKICDIIATYVSAWGEDERIADALIAAGIGDVSEYKEKLKLHRVFVRKDGGDIKVLYGNNEVDEIVKERNEYKHRAEVAERALYNCCFNSLFAPFGIQIPTVDELYDAHLKTAEKELAEEEDEKET